MCLGLALYVFSATVTPSWALPPIKDLTAAYPPMSDPLSARFTTPTSSDKQPTNGFVAAPTPNQEASAPPVVVKKGAEISPSIFSNKQGYRGDGYMAGSSPQIAQQPKRMSLPGINLKVPLY